MLLIETDIEGKMAHYGDLQDKIEAVGFVLGGDWEYQHGYFDQILWREQGETIYLRVPFRVISGELDQYNTEIRFLKPFVIKHIVHVGLDYEESSLLDATGFSQFQSPVDKDAEIDNPNIWLQKGKCSLEDNISPYLH